MNGTVTMCTEVTSYPTKELAEQVEKLVIEKNNDPNKPSYGFGVFTQIEKGCYYESLDEVPIAKKN